MLVGENKMIRTIITSIILYTSTAIDLLVILMLLFSKYRSTANSLSSKINIEPDISYLYNEIITKANPKMFIEPYQPNKLTTANEIYSEALKNKHNRDVLKKLLDRIKKEL